MSDATDTVSVHTDFLYKLIQYTIPHRPRRLISQTTTPSTNARQQATTRISFIVERTQIGMPNSYKTTPVSYTHLDVYKRQFLH